MERWVGKVAVVTGASSGIGAAIATELVHRGLQVLGLARRVAIMQDMAKSLSGRKGKLHALKTDVGKEEEVVEAFKWLRKNLGAAHVLVNNAGIAPYAPITQLEGDQIKKVRTCIDTNVMGVILCSNEAIKLMREKGTDEGHIINIGSIAGHFISHRMGFYVYNATKHAVTVLSEGYRRELLETNSKIRVTCVCPGYVKTNLGVASEIPNLEMLTAGKPWLKTEDITNSVIHALSIPLNVQISDITIQPLGERF